MPATMRWRWLFWALGFVFPFNFGSSINMESTTPMKLATAVKSDNDDKSARVQEENNTVARLEEQDDTCSSSSSIASRVTQRKRRFSLQRPTLGTSRRRLLKDEESGSNQRNNDSASNQQRNEDIAIIKDKFGHYQHHGTGNPLMRRRFHGNYAVTTLASIVQEGVLGQSLSDSVPQLKTERGRNGSFWTNRMRLAGSYGWTGLVLEKHADSSSPLPIQQVVWFLVESQEEMELLKSLLQEDKWKEVQDRVITVPQLAERARALTSEK